MQYLRKCYALRKLKPRKYIAFCAFLFVHVAGMFACLLEFLSHPAVKHSAHSMNPRIDIICIVCQLKTQEILKCHLNAGPAGDNSGTFLTKFKELNQLPV